MTDGNAGAAWTAEIVEARLVDAFVLHGPQPDDADVASLPCALASDFAEPDQDEIAEDREVRRTALAKIAADPTLFGDLWAQDIASMDRVRSFNAEILADEALEWIVQPETVDRIEQARLKVLSWFRRDRDQSTRAWCASKGLLPTQLVRMKAAYYSALATRLNESAIKVRGDRRIVWLFPIPGQRRRRCETPPHDLLFGFDEISTELRRGRSNTLRLIKGGKLPVGEIRGLLCASREALRPHKERLSRAA